VIFVVIFYEATLFNGILCEVDAGGLSLRKDRKGDDEDEVNYKKKTGQRFQSLRFRSLD